MLLVSLRRVVTTGLMLCIAQFVDEMLTSTALFRRVLVRGLILCIDDNVGERVNALYR
jgi:hypothetical protein